jgi:hypothetical protein
VSRNGVSHLHKSINFMQGDKRQLRLYYILAILEDCEFLSRKSLEPQAIYARCAIWPEADAGIVYEALAPGFKPIRALEPSH